MRGPQQWRTQGVSVGSADPPEIPRGARSGRSPDHFDARSDGWATGTYPRGKKDEVAVLLLGSAGPQMVGFGRVFMAGPIRVSMRRAREGLLYGGPRPGLRTAGLNRAFIPQTMFGPSVGGSGPDSQAAGSTGPSVDGPRPSPQLTGPGRALRRRAPTGSQSACPDRALSRRASTEPSIGVPRPGPQSTGTDRALIRRAPMALSRRHRPGL